MCSNSIGWFEYTFRQSARAYPLGDGDKSDRRSCR